MAEQTFSYNAPSASELRALYERPALDLQTPLANALAFRKMKQEEEATILANKIAQAKQALEERTAQSEMEKRAADLKTAAAGLVPSSAILDEKLRAGIEAGKGVRDIPISAVNAEQRDKGSTLGNFRAVARTNAGEAIVPLRSGGLAVIGADNKEIPYNPEVHGEPQPLVAPTLPPALTEKITNNLVTLKRLKQAKDTYNSAYVGPAESRLQRLSQATGIDFSQGLTGISALSPKAAEFKMTMANLVNDYVKATTGAQMSEHEVPRLMAAIPSTGKADEIFLSSVDAAMKIRKDTLKTEFDAAKAVGYRNTKDVEQLMTDLDKGPESAPKSTGFRIIGRRPAGK